LLDYKPSTAPLVPMVGVNYKSLPVVLKLIQRFMWLT